jgi:hypothetical protein
MTRLFMRVRQQSVIDFVDRLNAPRDLLLPPATPMLIMANPGNGSNVTFVPFNGTYTNVANQSNSMMSPSIWWRNVANQSFGWFGNTSVLGFADHMIESGQDNYQTRALR